MNDTVFKIGFGLLLFGPWALGVADILCIVAVGHQCSSMAWMANDAWRIPFVVFWPIAGFLIFGIIC